MQQLHDRPGRGGLTRWKLLKVQAEIDTRLGESISNRQLADCVQLSRFHFARAFRQSTGMSPQAYVFRRRLEHATRLMLSTDATLCEIAFECGFSDQSHLSRRFAEVLGTAPRVWRKERLAAQSIPAVIASHGYSRDSRSAGLEVRAPSSTRRATLSPAAPPMPGSAP